MMINSFLFLCATLVAMVDAIGLDEEELDYYGAAGTVGASSAGDDMATGPDDILAGSGLATLSESELLAGEEETSRLELGDPPAVSTPEPMDVTAALPQASGTRKSGHKILFGPTVTSEYRRSLIRLNV